MTNLDHNQERAWLMKTSLFSLSTCSLLVGLYFVLGEVQAQDLDHNKKRSSPSALISIPKGGLKPQAQITRGQIALQDLDATVKNGMPTLLAQVRLKPIKRQGRFIGFQLASLQKGSLIEQAGFQVDDIIMTVNNEPIGRPEQMMHTLSILPYAPHVSVVFERQGMLKKWTWLIRR